MGDLPKPAIRWQRRDYLRVVQAAAPGATAETLDRTNLRCQDTVDYYTTWVHQIKTPIASMRLLLQGEDSDFSRRAGRGPVPHRAICRNGAGLSCAWTPRARDYVFAPLRSGRASSARRCAASALPVHPQEHLTLRYEPLARDGADGRKVAAIRAGAGALQRPEVHARRRDHRHRSGGAADPLRCATRASASRRRTCRASLKRAITGYNGRADKKASGIGLYLCRPRFCAHLNHDISRSTPHPARGPSCASACRRARASAGVILRLTKL